MFQDALTIIDLEATGLRPEAGDRLTEIGLVRIERGRITARWESLVNCGVRLTSSVVAYTGITQSMVDAAPDPALALARALEFIGDAPLVAHGARFDEDLLRRECLRSGLAAPVGHLLCSLRAARCHYVELADYSLAGLAHSLRLKRGMGAHRAATDAETTAELVLQLGRDLAARRGERRVDIDVLRALAESAPSATLHALCA